MTPLINVSTLHWYYVESDTGLVASFVIMNDIQLIFRQ